MTKSLEASPDGSEQHPQQGGWGGKSLAWGQLPFQVKKIIIIKSNQMLFILYYLHHINKTYTSTPTSTCVPELLTRYKL